MGDPKWYAFEAQAPSDTRLYYGDGPLVLDGDHLRPSINEFDLIITVGREPCNLTQITHTQLVCWPPMGRLLTPTDEDGHRTVKSLPLVVVRIGYNLRYELGYLKYPPTLVQLLGRPLMMGGAPTAVDDYPGANSSGNRHELLLDNDISAVPII